MNFQRQYFIFSICILSFGCKNALEPNLVNDIVTEFKLKNSTGIEVSEFKPREDIHFEYTLENNTGDSLDYTVPDGGPFVTFEILQGDKLLGNSNDGFDYVLVVVQDSLLPGTSIAHKYNWLSIDLHDPLPEGDYVARAVPRLTFTDTETPADSELPFKVICDTDCDTTALVRITDSPLSAIEKDPFRLNSVRLRGNILTLNLSHSGGCANHTYSLYMSPKAFAESVPVQASLYLRHNANGDMCEAYITAEVSFNIKPIVDLHRQQYGNDAIIRLNLFDFSGHDNPNNLQILLLPEDSGNVFLRTGTFFGFCAGYCKFELQIDDTTATYFAYAWQSRMVPDRMITGSITSEESQKLKSLLDMDALFALEDVIGCPDCADGGGEWIEASTAEGTKKVTFEHGATIPAIDELMSELRTIRERFHKAMFGE